MQQQTKTSKKLLYLLSFTLPVFVMSYFCFSKHLLPFGHLSAFETNTMNHDLIVLYRFVIQLHNGSFSFLNPSGAYNMTMGETFPLYLSSPFTLFSALFPVSISFHILAALNILRIGLAGLAMFFFFNRFYSDSPNGKGNSLSPLVYLFFSLAYALSSCLIVQQIDYRFVDLSFLLPLLINAYRKLLLHAKSKSFYAILTIMLIDNASLSLTILLLLLLHLLIADKKSLSKHIVLRFLSITTISILSASITVFPTIRSVIVYGKEYKTWPDFSFNSDWLTFLTRFLPNSDASHTFMNFSGNNLYFSLVFFLLFFLSFFIPEVSLRKRIGRIVYTIILALALNSSSFGHIVSFPSFEQELFCQYNFVLIFYAIVLAAEALHHLDTIPLVGYLFSLILTTSLTFLAEIYAVHPVNTSDMFPVLILFILYLALFFMFKFHSVKKTHYYILAFFLLICELFINANHQLNNLSKNSTELSDQLYTLSLNDSSAYSPTLCETSMISSAASLSMNWMISSLFISALFR